MSKDGADHDADQQRRTEPRPELRDVAQHQAVKDWTSCTTMSVDTPDPFRGWRDEGIARVSCILAERTNGMPDVRRRWSAMAAGPVGFVTRSHRMPSKVRTGLAIIVSILPLNALRVFGYRLFGYEIKDSRIGIGTVIAVDAATIRSASIGPLNLFTGPFDLTIHPGATIGNRNEFSCGAWVTEPRYKESNYGRTLVIGADANITCRHFFDVTGKLVLGERSWVAGLGSQFWTHGAGVRERDIEIGSGCYVGSVVRFAPGSSVGNDVLVAMGSVVTGAIVADNALVGGVPAKVLKQNYDWRSHSVSEPSTV
jgi:acetyltransferase-like isoleucine patch superfamily enzyme